jgi:hypothetical protein
MSRAIGAQTLADGQRHMSDMETERAREAAQDLVNLLSEYELELTALEQDTPGVAGLRQAVGAALVQVAYWISDHAEPAPTLRTRH